MGSITEALLLEVPRRPFLFRNALDIARRLGGPVVGVQKTYLVLNANRVREVLRRPADFVSGPIYAPRLKLGPLILGMDPSTNQHKEERELLERWLSPTCFELAVHKYATDAIGDLKHQSHIELVTKVIEPVFVNSLCALFGIRPETASSKLVDGNGVTVIAQWMRKVGGLIASSAPAPFGLDSLTDGLKNEMAAFLNEQNHPAKSLAAEVRKKLGAQSVVRCVGGLMLPLATLFKAATLAIQKLLTILEPKNRQVACPAGTAEDGALIALQNGTASWVLIREALRFQPPIQMLVRYCPRPTTLGSKSIPAGSTVLVSLFSAMFDPDRIEDPEQFSISRPDDTYLLFGTGLHQCVAQQLAEAGLSALIGDLFATFDMKQRGAITYDGPAVSKYTVNVKLRPGVSNNAISPDDNLRTTGVRSKKIGAPPTAGTGT